ncbi:hypothetical protein K4L44_02560 [Halosquirtibacter laminarini]|uniref:Uncharacterized protein n=1 Tax=Halosquirtibacter laminarini TaxID=3374600 RepID=A0AC61NLD2_9BACT|nr:hypothetical protein K4L44_02560 [Prolixibacteraceae bacterium]
MKKIEKLLWVSYGISITLRLSLIKNNDIIIGTTLILLGVFYLIWSLYQFKAIDTFNKDQSYKSRIKTKSLIVGFGLFCTYIGCGKHIIMLLREHILLATYDRILDSGIVILCGVIIYEITLMVRQRKYIKSNILRKSVLGLIVGSLLWMISGTTEIEIIYRNYPRFIHAYKAVHKNPENKKLIEILNQEHKKIARDKDIFLTKQ